MSSIKAFRRVITNDPGVTALQDAVSPIFRDIQSKEILKGALIEDIVVTTATVQVAHKLGRRLKGWIVVRQNADANVWETTTSDPTRYLVLDSDATVTVSLWVF